MTRTRVLWGLAALLAAPWVVEWLITRRPPVPANLPRFVRPTTGRLNP